MTKKESTSQNMKDRLSFGRRLQSRAEKSTSYDAPDGSPEIINSDQGCQFTCKAWLDACAQHPLMRVSMEGRGRAKDNIWIERFWKTIKYKYIYILPEENGTALYSGIKRFIDNYNYHRRHQGIDRQVPSKLYIRPAA